MRVDFVQSDIRLAQPDFVDNFTYFSVLERLVDEQSQQRQWCHRTATKINSLMGDLNREIVAKVGMDSWNTLRRYINERRRTNHGIDQWNFDRDSDADSVARLVLGRRESVDRVAAILGDSRISKDDLYKIRQRYTEQINSLFRPTQHMGVLEEVDENNVPQQIRNATEHNQPITKMPPYDGAWHGGQLWHWGGSAPVLVSNLDGSLGRVGQTSTCTNLDSDDSDGFLIEWECTLGFWKNIPTTGKWDVWIKARCNKASSTYTYYNEWGESWVSSSMDAHLTFGADTWTGVNLANHVPYSAGTFWSSYSNGDWDGVHVFNKDWRTPGKAYWFHRPTFSTTPAKNGTFISVGTHDDLKSTINDMSTSLVMQNKWTIEKVSINIKP